MTTQHTDEMREAFDSWYSKEFSHVWHSQIGPEDTNHYYAQRDCWQAATASAEAEIAKWKARCIAAENGHPQVKEAVASSEATCAGVFYWLDQALNHGTLSSEEYRIARKSLTEAAPLLRGK